MRLLRDTRGTALVAVALLLMMACSAPDQVAVQPPPPPPATSAPFVVAPAASVVTAEPEVYVSLPADSIPTGVTATLRDRRSGASVTTPVLNGGFDPVAMPAVVGDSIDVTVQTTSAPLSYMLVVPKPRPPVVVRTDPPPNKRDVPLNSSLVVVFSEPIDPATLTGGAVQLLNGATVVPGQLSFRDAQHIAAEFDPAGPLAPSTTYQLVVSGRIKGPNGDTLSTPVQVTFTTTTTMVAGQLAFESTGEIWIASGDGTGATNLTGGHGGRRPRWSPDGMRLAFESARDGQPGIYVMNADGSGVTRLAAGSGPVSWSPDGARIAYVDGGIAVMNSDGTGVVHLADGSGPAWSPDGRRIAFAVTSGSDSATLASEVYLMNPDGSNVIQLAVTSLPGVGVSPPLIVWSPDGGKVALQGAVGSLGDALESIFTANADGSGMIRLNADPGPPSQRAECGATWSPDGASIAYWSWGLGITVNRRDGTFSGALVNSADADFTDWCGSVPAWSPDGTAIAFNAVVSGAAVGSSGIMSMRTDGSGISVVSRFGGNPVWRPAHR